MQRSVNDAGDAVGSSWQTIRGGNLDGAGFLYRNGTLIGLGGPGTGYPDVGPEAINNSDQITGAFNPTLSGPPHAFAYSNGKFTDIGTLGGQQSIGYGINDLGQIVGSSFLAGAQPAEHAFLYANGKMSDLGMLPGPGNLSEAFGINNVGQVVGESNGLAVLWDGGRIYDLSRLLATNAPFALAAATHINDLGQIIGQGYDPKTGMLVGFLLTPADLPPVASFTPISPVPEPCTFAIFGALGLGSIAFRRGSRPMGSESGE